MDHPSTEHDAKRRHSDPALSDCSDGHEPQKRSKTEASDDLAEQEKDLQISFKSAEEIANALSTTNADLLVQGLTHAREHFRLCNRKLSSSSDSAQARLLQEANRRVVYEWAEQAGDFESISTAWQFALNNAVPRLDGIIPSAIAALLATLDTPATARYGTRLIRMVLDGFLKAIYRAFSTPRSFACSAALLLLHQIVVFAKGEHADEVRQTFDWTMKSLESLPLIRSSGTGISIRAQWIRFVFSFFSAEHCRGYNELLKAGNVVANLFRGAERDSYSELHEFLALTYTNVVANPNVERAGRVRCFSPRAVESLVKVVGTKDLVVPADVGVSSPATFIPEGQAQEQPAIATDSLSALALRFLNGLMTYPGVGICFKEYGLYAAPRRWHLRAGERSAADQDAEDNHDVAVISKASSSTQNLQYLCNSAIMRILAQCINPSSSKEMAELVVRILRVSPELIAPFWRNVSCSFEPRLSLMYLANTTFALKVLGLPLPVPKEHDVQHSGPPQLNTLVEHIIPVALARSLLGRGLQHRASLLVRYRNLLLIDLALRKLDEARAWIQSESRRVDAGISDANNKWLQLERRLLAAVKQRMPEWLNIVFVHQELVALAEGIKTGAADAAGGDLREAECQHAVLSNVVMRVINGYQRHFNELVVESRFEIGRLIADIHLPDAISSGGLHSGRIRNPINAHTLLYLLRALATTPASHIKWGTRAKADASAGQNDPAPHTYLGVVLMLHLFSVQPELRRVARSVCINALHSTGLFDHEAGISTSGAASAAGEASCWLDALASLVSPHANHSVRLAHIPETQLAKGHALVAFFEDAAGYATKLPYKYVDQIQAHMGDADSAELGDGLPFSPLLPAIVEAGVLKTAAGNGALAASLRGASRKQIEAEMMTNPMFVFAREVACQIAESKGWAAARHLQSFMCTAASSVLQGRAVKEESEKQHYAEVEAAFLASSSDVLAYLSIMNAPGYEIGTCTAAKPRGGDDHKLPHKVSKHLKSELAAACADIENSLAPFIERLSGVLHENSELVSPQALTKWILKQAVKMGFDERKSALRVAAAWMSLSNRVGSPTASLWDQPTFTQLAPEILLGGDGSLLLVLLRHLLVSSQLAQLLDDSSVQMLLTHILAASKGSATFCFYAIQLVLQLAARESANKQSTTADQSTKAMAFVFDLATAHLTSLAPAERGTNGHQKPPAAIALEKYAAAFGPLVRLAGDSAFQTAIDFYVSVFACRSSQNSLRSKGAPKTWLPLAKRIETAAFDAFESPSSENGEKTGDILALLRIVAPILSTSARVYLVKALDSFASSMNLSSGLLSSVIATVLALASGTDDAAASAGVNVQSIKEALSARVVSLWISAFKSRERDAGAALEHAADLATKQYAVFDYSQLASRQLPRNVCQRISSAKASLPHFDRVYSSASAVDIEPLLGYLWHYSNDDSTYNADEGKRDILARLLGADSKLRVAAAKWADGQIMRGGLAGRRFDLAVWLLHTLASSCSYVDGRGLVVWDSTSLSDIVRASCLNLGRNGFAMCQDDISLSERASNADLMFVANFCIQALEESANPLALWTQLTDSSDRALIEARAQALRSKALRVLNFPGQTDLLYDAMHSTIAFGQEMLSDFVKSTDPSQATWNALATITSTLEHCLRCQADCASAASSGKRNEATQHALEALQRGFKSIDGVIRSICESFSSTVDMASSEVQNLATRYPAPVYRFIAFSVQAMQAVASIDGLVPDSDLRWFATLKHLLDCRVFSDRVWSADLRSSLVLTVSGLWSLAKPSLSRWSASLDDYLTLDQLESLIGAYGGTCSVTDNVLLRVIGDYEATTGQSIQRVALMFGPSAASTYVKERLGRCQYLIERNENDVGVVGEETISQAVLTIDSGRLFRTVLNFPVNSVLAADSPDPASLLLSVMSDSSASGLAGAMSNGQDVYDSDQVYNPHFVLPWLWTIVSSKLPFDFRKLFESNAVGLALAALSSADPRLRKLAYYILDGLYPLLARAERLGGQRQYLLLFDSLRNAITDRSESEFPRIPFTTTLFVATSINVMMHPDHVMFGEVNRLLLSRPYLKLNKIPLLHSVLRSSSNPRRERVHVLRIASHGARAFDLNAGTFRRNNFVNVMLALASNPLGDVLISRAVFALLFHLTSADNAESLAQHVSRNKFSLLAWIRGQVSLQVNALLESASLSKAEAAADDDSSGGSVLSSLQRMQAAITNLTAFMRLIGRITMNFPLSRSDNDELRYAKFWVVQSPNQSSASGQSAVMSIIQRVLEGLSRSLETVGSTIEPMQASLVKPALALVRSSLETAQVLMQMQSNASAEQPTALRSAQIARFAIAALRCLEPAIDRQLGSQPAATAQRGKSLKIKLCYDACSIAATSKAQFSESLFRADVVTECTVNDRLVGGDLYASLGSVCENYRACVDSLFSCCFETPWDTCSRREFTEVAGRALAINASSAAKAVSGIREALQ
ncbi:hypothetical protein GQ54DRAFT_297833 [Martensiomyces pterosporus]|nr:hypothetical protein GQ54DRAFT_297833 [Martensiomyces pterosporus]